MLDCKSVETFTSNTNEDTCERASVQQTRISKSLFRSNSSSLHRRQSTLAPATKLNCELDQIFVISSNRSSNIDEGNYDSISVIDERRIKNMKDLVEKTC